MNPKSILLLCVMAIITMIMSCGDSNQSTDKEKDPKVKAFEQRVYQRRSELLHEHTYDPANIAVADSIYKESEKLNSEYGKMVALQIKYYACIVDTTKGDEFIKAVDEYLVYAKKQKEKEVFFDGMNAKLYYLMQQKKYMSALYMVKDALKEAETSQDSASLYFTNYMMAAVYQNRGNYSIVIPYLEKAEKYCTSDSLKLALVNRELSAAYAYTKNFEKAFKKAEICLRYAPTTVYKVWGEHQYLQSLFELKRYNDFIAYWKTSYINTHDISGTLPDHMLNILKAELCVCKKDYEGAIRFANEIGYDETRNNVLLSIYSAQGNYEKAFQIRTTIDSARDSLQTSMQIGDLSEMDARLGNSHLKLQSEQVKSRSQYILFISVIVILVVISLCISVISYRNRKHVKELDNKNQQLQTASEIAAKASEAKSVFIGNMSHELNTPLNHVYGFAQMIADDNITSSVEEYKEMAGYICDSSKQLKHVIDNITEVSDKLSKLTKLEDVESVVRFDSQDMVNRE